MKMVSRILVLLVAFTTPVLAQSVSPEESIVLDRWEIDIGAFATGINTQIRFDERLPGGGTTVDLEDDLGFDSNEFNAQLSVAYIFGRRHALQFSYLEIDRTGFTELRRDIQWGDEMFEIGIDVASRYDADFYSLGYTYWVRARERSAWGLSFDLVRFGSSSGIAIAPMSGLDIGIDSDFDLEVPVPQFGVKWSQALSRKWVFNTQAAFIAFDDIDDFSGDVISGYVNFEHRTWKHFGFGGGYRLQDFDIDSGEERTLGNYKFEIRGFYLYGRLGF